MNRKDFIKSLVAGAVVAPEVAKAAMKANTATRIPYPVNPMDGQTFEWQDEVRMYWKGAWCKLVCRKISQEQIEEIKWVNSYIQRNNLLSHIE